MTTPRTLREQATDELIEKLKSERDSARRELDQREDRMMKMAADNIALLTGLEDAKREIKGLKKNLSGWQDRYTNLRRELDIDQPTQPDGPDLRQELEQLKKDKESCINSLREAKDSAHSPCGTSTSHRRRNEKGNMNTIEERLQNQIDYWKHYAKGTFDSDLCKLLTDSLHELESLQKALEAAQQRIEKLIEELKIAEAHVGWGDCSLENVHTRARKVLAEALENEKASSTPIAP